jgi:hypothetical protein
MELERSVVLTYLLLARKRRGAWGTDSDRCSGLGVRWVIREKAVCPASFLGGVSCVARYEFDMYRPGGRVGWSVASLVVCQAF